MVFHGSLRESKSPQVSMTFLTILAVLNNVEVWMVSTRPPTSKSSSPFSNSLITVTKVPISIGIIVTCMFHSFFQFPCKVEVFILLFTFFQFYSVVSRDSKVDNFVSSLFLFIIKRSGLLAESWWYYYYYYYSLIRIFHINISWWSFTEVWVTASLLKSPGLLLLLLCIPLEFFTLVLADGFSLEFKWQQVSSSLQDSSQDSGRSQQCCHLDSLYPSANFQVFQAF